MTTKQAPSVIQMEREQLVSLLTSVEETLATDVDYFQSVKNPKNFSAIQLWNIRRKARYNNLVIR